MRAVRSRLRHLAVVAATTTALAGAAVAEADPPPGTGLVSPTAGARVPRPLTLKVHAPAGAAISFYVADSPGHDRDGLPTGDLLASCDVDADTDADYTCTDDGEVLEGGKTYYWWVTINLVDGSLWIYGPRAFMMKTAAGSGSGRSGASGRTLADAPKLATSDHFDGKSIKHGRLSRASYDLTKIVGVPKSIAIGCWNGADWRSISGYSGDGVYSLMGFYYPRMPHWVQLSPAVCRSFETLLYKRPQYPNVFTASAVETLTHEMMHALGVVQEARAECFGMQLSIVLAQRLGVPVGYAQRLSHLTLELSRQRPELYRDYARCRENGAWDLFPGRDSPPWHNF